MPHIHTKPGEHDHTVSAYIVRIDGREPRLLFHRHKKFGVYMQFGGHIELLETPWQTLTHEIREESGYELDQLMLLQPETRIKHLDRSDVHPMPATYNTHKVGDSHFHTDLAYAFVTTEEPRHLPKEGESNDLRLFNRGQVAALTEAECFQNVKDISLFILDEILNNWSQVPAADI